jgi:hypothetical protein
MSSPLGVNVHLFVHHYVWKRSTSYKNGGADWGPSSLGSGIWTVARKYLLQTGSNTTMISRHHSHHFPWTPNPILSVSTYVCMKTYTPYFPLGVNLIPGGQISSLMVKCKKWHLKDLVDQVQIVVIHPEALESQARRTQNYYIHTCIPENALCTLYLHTYVGVILNDKVYVYFSHICPDQMVQTERFGRQKGTDIGMYLAFFLPSRS